MKTEAQIEEAQRILLHYAERFKHRKKEIFMDLTAAAGALNWVLGKPGRIPIDETISEFYKE